LPDVTELQPAGSRTTWWPSFSFAHKVALASVGVVAALEEVSRL